MVSQGLARPKGAASVSQGSAVSRGQSGANRGLARGQKGFTRTLLCTVRLRSKIVTSESARGHRGVSHGSPRVSYGSPMGQPGDTKESARCQPGVSQVSARGQKGFICIFFMTILYFIDYLKIIFKEIELLTFYF